ncbi:hypothetical protein P8V03_07890 [Clostridium sp. A1-XYC3]|uniref:Uncharacterized protein n=1 Tax=Clostridium tanneri TaxID=3037988 RepID=A0ABU4JSK3_9CLOT|nr:hypothetical protein [Clostridium sp. A1-XYC3]MDW8801076.1 hypothetical protein [Clostridium sp. A1-XYC3]
MFNYYKRIAQYANDLENDGKVSKANQIREILRNENRCILCGSKMIFSNGFWSCNNCIIGNCAKIEQQQDCN